MSDALSLVRASVERLATIVRPLGDDDLQRPAYPTEWTIADVLSHLGSGAVIFGRLAADTLAGQETRADFNQGVWDQWNAKSPRAQADDALAADAELVREGELVSDEDRARFHVSFGPMQLGWESFLGMRLSEHVLHTWDVAVVLDPSATLPADAVEVLIERLAMIVGWAGRPNAAPQTVVVRTTSPERTLAVTIGEQSVALTPADAGAAPQLTLPAEAFVRLVYGRLDPAHTPPVDGDAALLDTLRAVFPGF